MEIYASDQRPETTGKRIVSHKMRTVDDSKRPVTIRLHTADNVSIASVASGMIPAGHKVATAAIAAGEAVVKYGQPIGIATVDIAVGGGTSVISETTELYGAEHLLVRRSRSPEVARKLLRCIDWWRELDLVHDRPRQLFWLQADAGDQDCDEHGDVRNDGRRHGLERRHDRRRLRWVRWTGLACKLALFPALPCPAPRIGSLPPCVVLLVPSSLSLFLSPASH